MNTVQSTGGHGGSMRKDHKQEQVSKVYIAHLCRHTGSYIFGHLDWQWLGWSIVLKCLFVCGQFVVGITTHIFIVVVIPTGGTKLMGIIKLTRVWSTTETCYEYLRVWCLCSNRESLFCLIIPTGAGADWCWSTKPMGIIKLA